MNTTPYATFKKREGLWIRRDRSGIPEGIFMMANSPIKRHPTTRRPYVLVTDSIAIHAHYKRPTKTSLHIGRLLRGALKKFNAGKVEEI